MDSVLAEVVEGFAATVAGDFSAEDVLRQLAEAAMRVLPIDGAGVMVPHGEDLLRFVFATGPLIEQVSAVEVLQEQQQRGPCKDSHAAQEVVDVADLHSASRWPDYQARALTAGLHAVTAVPLVARGRGWGVLDLYRTEPRTFDEQHFAAARTLAHLATSYLVVAEDRDSARSAREQLAHRAMHDPLTDLPVRWVYLEQLQHALARLARHPGHVAVLFVDLDGLKYVNDTWGHPAGDELILTCVRRIKAALRPTDTVARLGGDEFLVLLEELDLAAARAVAERILTELAAPYRAGGTAIQPSASIGVALTDDPRSTPDSLIAHADSAMYRAKRTGRGRYELFDPVSYAADRRLASERDDRHAALRRALHRGELVLHYQPIVDLAARDREWAEGPLQPGEGSVYGVEALVRWQQPDSLRLPGEFLPVAERSGLMDELGGWVLDTACRQLATWDRELGPHAPARLFVNASVQELRPDLPDRLRDVLAEHGLDPGRLTVEITETGLFTDPDAVLACVNGVTALGCRLALDDFGTGYSSLSRLVELPSATIKIDRAFARTLPSGPTAAAVISAVLLLGRDLDRTVVVEGVETLDEVRALRALGCRYAQGFHLARPLPAPELDGLLGARRSA